MIMDVDTDIHTVHGLWVGGLGGMGVVRRGGMGMWRWGVFE